MDAEYRTEVFDLVDEDLVGRYRNESWEAYLERNRDKLSSENIKYIEDAINYKWQDMSPYQYLMAKRTNNYIYAEIKSL